MTSEDAQFARQRRLLSDAIKQAFPPSINPPIGNLVTYGYESDPEMIETQQCLSGRKWNDLPTLAVFKVWPTNLNLTAWLYYLPYFITSMLSIDSPKTFFTAELGLVISGEETWEEIAREKFSLLSVCQYCVVREYIALGAAYGDLYAIRGWSDWWKDTSAIFAFAQTKHV